MTKKVAEIQIKKEIDSENVAPSELDFAENKVRGFFYFYSKECSWISKECEMEFG